MPKDQPSGLVNTDVQGIQNAENSLIPGVTAQGNQLILKRTSDGRGPSTPSINPDFPVLTSSTKDLEVAQTNDFNRSQFEQNVDSTGVELPKTNHRRLNALGTEATGSFGDHFSTH